MFENLTNSNYTLYAMKFYDNPQCLSEDDFYNDIKILKYLKRLFNRYNLSGELKTRLILNHLIMFTNVFPPQVASRILFLKIPKEHWSVLKTFLDYLNFMPDYLEKINGEFIYNKSIQNNKYVLESLKKELKCQ
tara:strand:- start:511 stop:912 length:402 start_codon:yes stop_codon:yes gene_type:complete